MEKARSIIRLTFLVRSLDYGGTQRQLVTLAKALDKTLFDVIVLTFYSGHPFQQELHASGIQVTSLEKQGRWDVLGFSYRLIQQIRRIRPDILHSYLDIPNLVALFIRLFVPIKVVWGVRTSDIHSRFYDWLRRISAILERLCARFADLIVVNSTAGLEHHTARGFPAEKMVLIPNGVDTEEFRPDELARSKLRCEWGIAEDRKLVGIIGRLDPMKDHLLFLQTARYVSQARADVDFVCVGAGAPQYEKTLREKATRMDLTDRLLWPGTHDDMRAVYNALDTLVSTSHAEGFSNVIAEAMACGVPCVATAVGDSPEIMGAIGRVVPTRDAEALAEAIVSCLQLDRKEIREMSRCRIVENFSAKQLARRTENLLLSLLSASNDKAKPQQNP